MHSTTPGLCAFSSERPSQQESVHRRGKGQQHHPFADIKTVESNGGLLCAIRAFIIIQPAANGEQEQTWMPNEKPQTTAVAISQSNKMGVYLSPMIFFLNNTFFM